MTNLSTSPTATVSPSVQFCPVYQNRERPVSDCLNSELLSLAYSSDVPNPDARQFERAQQALAYRKSALKEGWTVADESEAKEEYIRLCREIVDEHLAAHEAHFGFEQCAPYEDINELAHEGRDIFLIIKFMDEERHIRSTIESLLTQQDVDLSRVVLIGVDNMSIDSSGETFCQLRDTNTSPVHMIYCQQPTSGGGSAARLGVDRSIATVREIARLTGDWNILHRARIAVSDGDTIYHPRLLADSTRIFDEHPDVDGVMPFLTYKLTACLRLFDGWQERDQAALLENVQTRQKDFVAVQSSLDTQLAHEDFPRSRRQVFEDGIALWSNVQCETIKVSFVGVSKTGERFGVLVDPKGNHALVFEDRFLSLNRAPMAGYDSALVYLENGRVKPDEVWRWHSLIGHDLFLLWCFNGMGFSKDLILPDTSDALKSFRVWAFAVGGQHQLSRPGTARVTGTDYQSGRVLQSYGARTVLGASQAHSETEIDRLAKMIRNFANEQSVFYGNTRSGSLERASGLYLHMSRIQDEIEAEVKGYSEELYKGVVFPERILFPLRWMLQNYICAYFCADETDRELVLSESLDIFFSRQTCKAICNDVLHPAESAGMEDQQFETIKSRAEELAEDIIRDNWVELMGFYETTLRDFFDSEGIGCDVYDPLLKPITGCRNSLEEERPFIDVNEVWSPERFSIDYGRGQVLEVERA